MNDPQNAAPETLAQRVQKMVERARKLGISNDLVAKYARMVIAAEEVVAYRAATERLILDEMAIVAALEHGICESDPEKARVLYAAARKAQLELHNSAKGVALRIGHFKKQLAARHGSLQVDAAGRFPLDDVMAACDFIAGFAAATAPHPSNLAVVKFAKSELSFTKEGHALQWWQQCMPKYKDKWGDMHKLALCWHLTFAKDIRTFQRGVRKLRPVKTLPQGTWMLRCPPWATP